MDNIFNETNKITINSWNIQLLSKIILEYKLIIANVYLILYTNKKIILLKMILKKATHGFGERDEDVCSDDKF